MLKSVQLAGPAVPEADFDFITSGKVSRTATVAWKQAYTTVRSKSPTVRSFASDYIMDPSAEAQVVKDKMQHPNGDENWSGRGVRTWKQHFGLRRRSAGLLQELVVINCLPAMHITCLSHPRSFSQ